MKGVIDPLSILVIEDNELFRNLSVEMLSEYNVLSAKDAAEGLDKYTRHNPDITFLDIGLPDKNGQDLLDDIMKINPQSFVVMLTASNLKSDVQESLNKGAKGYIIKPFSRKRLKDVVEKYYVAKQ